MEPLDQPLDGRGEARRAERQRRRSRRVHAGVSFGQRHSLVDPCLRQERGVVVHEVGRRRSRRHRHRKERQRQGDPSHHVT